MERTYKIEVDCANCANLMEDAIKKTEGVKSATLSFMTQKLTVTFEEGFSEKEVMKRARKAAKRIDDDFEIYL